MPEENHSFCSCYNIEYHTIFIFFNPLVVIQNKQSRSTDFAALPLFSRLCCLCSSCCSCTFYLLYIGTSPCQSWRLKFDKQSVICNDYCFTGKAVSNLINTLRNQSVSSMRHPDSSYYGCTQSFCGLGGITNIECMQFYINIIWNMPFLRFSYPTKLDIILFLLVRQ